MEWAREWGLFLSFLIALISVVAAVRREIIPLLKKILEEFKPNGGSSLVDRIQRMEQRQVIDFRTTWNALDGGDVGIWQSNADGLTTDANDALLEMAGLSRHEILGHGWKSAIHPRDLPHVESVFRAAVRDQRSFEMSYRFRHRNGFEVPIHARCVPIRHNGQLVAFAGRVKREEPRP